jgi:hypothetical protein
MFLLLSYHISWSQFASATFSFLLKFSVILLKIGEQCLSDQWPPKPDRALPTYIVNLDAPPQERWKAVSAVYKDEVR